MSTAERFDLVILGSGSAAFAAAIKAAELGARVAMTENRQIGGTCVNRGCIPSKNLIRAAEIYHSGNHQPFCGLNLAQQGLDAGELIAQKDELVERLRHKKYIDIVEENERITLFAGPARFVARDRIRVGEEILAAPKFLVATGARPRTEVGIEGLSRVDYLTSDLLASGEPMELKTLPRSWVIIGGGFIACELGQMFRRLGAEVILLERGPRLLSGLDEEVADSLGKILEEEGVRIVFHARPVKAAAIRDTRGLVKMVIDAKSRRILGVHLIAHRGADLIHEAALAVKFGLTVEDLIETIHVYPTMSEAIRMAAQTFARDVSKLSCCAE